MCRQTNVTLSSFLVLRLCFSLFLLVVDCFLDSVTSCGHLTFSCSCYALCIYKGIKLFRQLHLNSRSQISKSKMSSFASKESKNPLLSSWATVDHELPPFSLIKPQHYKDAISIGFSQHLSEVKAIAEEFDEPTFENTIARFDQAGGALTRVLNVFHNMCSSNTCDELQAVEMDMAGPLAEHETVVITFPGVFPRVASIHASRHTLQLTPEQLRLTERIHLDFIRAGAEFSPESQARYKQIVMRLAELMTQFAQNVLADEAGFTLELNAQQLGGLPADLVAGAKQAAAERHLPLNSYAISLSRSLVCQCSCSDERTR